MGSSHVRFSENLGRVAKAEVEESVAAILGQYAEFFTVTILQDGKQCTISWAYDEAAIIGHPNWTGNTFCIQRIPT